MIGGIRDQYRSTGVIDAVSGKVKIFGKEISELYSYILIHAYAFEHVHTTLYIHVLILKYIHIYIY